MTKKTVKTMMVMLMILTVGFYFVSGTYARYTSTATGTATASVAKWAVKINDTDATAASATFDLEFTEVTNANVVDGKIAPASQLYAEFEIDPSGSEVAMDYSFTLGNITALSGTVPTTLKVSKVVTVDGDTETEVSATDGKYTGTIALASQSAALSAEEAVTIRVYVEWTNSDANDATDTTIGVAAPTLTMNVNATASQHIA